jgi:transposase
MLFLFQHKIWFYRTPIDFRKQIDGLVILISGVLKRDPTSGQLFIFRNRTGNKIKLLWWDETGFWLLYKRLERDRFKFPRIMDEPLEVSRDQLQLLLSGIDFEKQKYLEKVTAKRFY